VTTFRWGSDTDTGRVRSVNQDNSLVVAGRLFALADGMGGHLGGEVASEVALAVIGDELSDYTTVDLVDAVREANRRIHQRAGTDPDLTGMGTTVCALALVESAEGAERLALVNVGDSRVYRQRADGFEQLTDDHSLVASLVREGRLSAEEAAVHPQRNVLTRALGIDTHVKVDSWELAPVTGDRYLLCSDGLFNEVEESRIASTLRRLDEPGDACRELVRLANDGGGRDNITCVVVDVLDGPGSADGAAVSAGDTDVHPVVPPLDDDEVDGEPDAGADDASPGDETAVGATAAAAAPPNGRDEFDPDLGRVGDDLDDDEDAVAPAAPRRFTWRVFAFGLALVVLLAATAGFVAWYGRNTYFVSFDADEVVIFKGRPGGFLWFDPTLEERSGIDRRDVPPGLVDEIDAGRDQATLEDARRFVRNLEDQVAEATTTTSTTVPARSVPTTPTPAAGPRAP
jgi:protein phosphatase